jgi:hypothetical protein
MKLQFFSTDVRKILKFRENPPSESLVVPYGNKSGQTGMAKVIVVFSNFGNAPRNLPYCR